MRRLRIAGVKEHWSIGSAAFDKGEECLFCCLRIEAATFLMMVLESPLAQFGTGLRDGLQGEVIALGTQRMVNRFPMRLGSPEQSCGLLGQTLSERQPGGKS